MCKNNNNVKENVEVKEFKEEQIRILNLEGSWLKLNGNKEEENFNFSTTEERVYTTKDGQKINFKPKINKLYSATMPYSLETLRAYSKVENEVFGFENDDEQYTKLFVNFKFTKNYIDDSKTDTEEVRINKKKLREKIYTSKVQIDNEEYVFFKRGASKARTANVIFVKKKYKDELLKPSLLGLKFIEGQEYDITSMEAYVSLIMSGIIGTLEIKAEQILIIDDVMSPVKKHKQTITTRDEDGNIYQDNGEDEEGFEVINNMSDGQVLMDESLFVGKVLEKATCALLRNDFFKGNACRTKLQKYFNSQNPKITQVWDKYREWIDADKIKLVITPSACKYLKFKDQFNSEKECFEDWLKNIPEKFGIVKTDHVGNYGYSNRLSYQMLNSMNLSYIEIEQLMEDELNYYRLLKDNTTETSETIKKMTKKNKQANRDERNKMSNFLGLVLNNNDKLSTGDMISDLLKRNSDFRFTPKFKDWKNEQLQDYVENLRKGKIRIQNSIYAIMISCPYEMLKATHSKHNKIDSCIMDGWECYCPTFDNGAELLAIRNPQINAGNIAKMTVKYHEEYKWFGYYENEQAKHDFVVFVNTYNTDIMNRLQGCDFDIDSVYLTNNKLLVEKAEDSQLWSTPVNGIEGDKANRVYDSKSLAKLDNYLGGSTMSIGKVVNKSAIFNAYMYDGINKEMNEDYVNKCYEASSTLSSFSQVAIDMAKKTFTGLSLSKEMNNLNNKTYKDEEGKEKQILRYAIAESTITIEDYIKDLIKVEINEEYEERFELIDKVDDLNSLKVEYKKFKEDKENKTKLDKKFNVKIKVKESKMIVPYFFTYIAKDNSYRIPTYMECSMDYLEKILDNLDTKAIQTDKREIKDLLIQQKDLRVKAYDKSDVDKVRVIIDNCQSILNKNRYNCLDNGEETNKKANLRKWAKKEAIKELKELKLNEKTVYRILMRALEVDTLYKPIKIEKINNDGEVIKYINKEGKESVLLVKEFSEMTMLTLNLLHKSYGETFIKCFKENKSEVEKCSFWK